MVGVEGRRRDGVIGRGDVWQKKRGGGVWVAGVEYLVGMLEDEPKCIIIPLCYSKSVNPPIHPSHALQNPLNSFKSTFSLCPTTLSKRSAPMTNVPLPPVKLLKCFR